MIFDLNIMGEVVVVRWGRLEKSVKGRKQKKNGDLLPVVRNGKKIQKSILLRRENSRVEQKY
jgi:hypothetical protein